MLGYHEAAAIAEEAHRTGKTVREIVLAKDLLSAAELDSLLDLTDMTRPAIQEEVGDVGSRSDQSAQLSSDQAQRENRWRDDGGQR